MTSYFDYEHQSIELRTQDSSWIAALRQRAADSRAWGYAAMNAMKIYSPEEATSPSSPGSRPVWEPSRSGGSTLYDETPLFQEPRAYRKRPTIHGVFQLADAAAAEDDDDRTAPTETAHDRHVVQPVMLMNPVTAPPPPPSPPNSRSRSSSSSTSLSSGSLPSWGSVRGLSNFWRFTRSSVRK